MRALVFALLSLLPVVLSAQTRYIAFGDSITEGFGDDAAGDEQGYPPRLARLLQDRGEHAVVENHGRGGETTAGGVTRIDEVLAGGGDVLLLMEGTNDISQRISEETIRFNLAEIARKAASRALSTVHATVVPRLPMANTDGSNRATTRLAGEIRDLSWSTNSRLADPFEVFSTTPDVFDLLFVGGTDKLHPNAAGYDLIAEIFADVLTDVDNVPPVTGLLDPQDNQRDVPAETAIMLNVYDFGEGIDLANTALLVNGQIAPAQLDGDLRKVEIFFQPLQPLRGLVSVGLRSQDLALPPNTVDRTLAEFLLAGTELLDGDIDEDGRVDGADLVAFAMRFGAVLGDSRYQGFADFNGDGLIDGEDLAILAANFGRSAF